VSRVNEDGPADQADIQPGDVIVGFNGNPVDGTEDLQGRVTGTRPGTTLPVDVIRNGEPLTLSVTIGELNLETEGRTERGSAEEISEGFGITLQDLTEQTARRLRVPQDTVGVVVVDVARGSTSESRGLQPGDVVITINRTPVTSVAEATAQLNAVESGRTAFLLVQRAETRIFLQVPKE